MRIRFVKGVSGFWKGQSIRYPRGFEGDFTGDEERFAKGEVRAGNAVEVKDMLHIPTPEAVAITPTIRRVDVVTRKRGRPKNV